MNLRRTLATLTLATATAFGGWAVGHHPTPAPPSITADDVHAVLGEGQTVADACGRGHEACEAALAGSRGMALAGRSVTFWEDGSWSLAGSDPASEDAYTAAFNDGWATGMQDACDQGSAYACDWLATTN
ncbi:hypothetical protein ADK60_38590 [Streptomyces sp. XY431]|uniref:hypothetical protein n=1 Tax=Streptomyces sp. XY431 TaxID=1415562 RepID=UPI0006ADF3B9|nr:hypothetical protein [Streptomyces sp. XY431]KOV10159.1 hypothetical protein ADK60_38590 [Streptomyces sp. XY431]